MHTPQGLRHEVDDLCRLLEPAFPGTDDQSFLDELEHVATAQHNVAELAEAKQSLDLVDGMIQMIRAQIEERMFRLAQQSARP